ncbi:MAG TPA: hypothetical protein VIM84_03660 [Gemmatimonadales bacterium]
MSTPSDQRPRIVYPASCVQTGDLIRIRPEHVTDITEPSYTLRVTRIQREASCVKILTDRFPIGYTVLPGALIEVLDFTRTVYFHCVVCDPASPRRSSPGTGTPVVVGMATFLHTSLLAYSNLPVICIEPPHTSTQLGYCEEHADQALGDDWQPTHD